MKSSKKDGVGPVRALLCRVPELFLRRVSIHRADPKQTPLIQSREKM